MGLDTHKGENKFEKATGVIHDTFVSESGQEKLFNIPKLMRQKAAETDKFSLFSIYYAFNHLEIQTVNG